jgi:hypothetical protein
VSNRIFDVEEAATANKDEIEGGKILGYNLKKTKEEKTVQLRAESLHNTKIIHHQITITGANKLVPNKIFLQLRNMSFTYDNPCIWIRQLNSYICQILNNDHRI